MICLMSVLMLHVAADDVLVKSNGGGKVPSCPHGIFVVEVSRALDLLFHPRRTLAFQYLHNVRDGVAGACKQYQVYVVVLDVELEYLPLFRAAD